MLEHENTQAQFFHLYFLFGVADAYFITAGKHVRAECVYSFLLFVMKM